MIAHPPFGRIGVAALVIAMLSSAASGMSDEEYTRIRFDAQIGKSIGQISTESMRFPVNYYEDSEGRNFVYEFGTCSALLKTKARDQNFNADSWVIYGYSARGWCGALF